MKKLSFAALVVAIAFAGCASQQSPASDPDSGPSGVEFEFAGGDEEVAPPEEVESTEVPSDRLDVTQPEPSVSESPKPRSEKATCAGREQKLCEVTVGCAWSTEKICVEQ